MTHEQAAGPMCSLESREFKERVSTIAEFNARALLDRKRSGRTLLLTYAPGTAAEVADLIAKENDCCSFLDFRSREDESGVVLTITVPEQRADEADDLLAPFDGTSSKVFTSCCGTC